MFRPTVNSEIIHSMSLHPRGHIFTSLLLKYQLARNCFKNLSLSSLLCCVIYCSVLVTFVLLLDASVAGNERIYLLKLYFVIANIFHGLQSQKAV